MRCRADRRLVDPVQGALLSLRDSVSDFRRRSAVPAALRRRLHDAVHRRPAGDARVYPAAGRGPRLGLASRPSRMDMSDTPDITPEQRDELRRHGILLTSLEELSNWGRSHSVWPLQFGLAFCAIEMIAA